MTKKGLPANKNKDVSTLRNFIEVIYYINWLN